MNNLRALRETRQLTRQALADRTAGAVSMATVVAVEHGVRFPSPRVKAALAGALGYPVPAIFPPEQELAAYEAAQAATRRERATTDNRETAAA